MLVMVTCAVYQILTLVFKVAILSIVVACYLGVSIYQSLNENNVEPTGRWLAGVLVLFFMACLVAHSQHTEATYRSSVPFRYDDGSSKFAIAREYVVKHENSRFSRTDSRLE